MSANELDSRNCRITLPPLTVAALYRMHVEELALEEALREEYADDCGSTKRLIAGVF